MEESILEVRNLKKYFPIYAGIFRHKVGDIKAVDGIDFKIMPGQVLGVVGESGSGKSTAARAAIRLTEPTAGEIYFQGKAFHNAAIETLREARRNMQMVFQDPYASLNPRKTVAESIGEGLLYHGIVKNRKERDDAVVEVLKQVGLSASALQCYPHEFSGGQQQRICIGRAIAIKPKLVICDESVSALDVSIQAQILNLLIELKEELGLSYLFISHDLSVVRHICDTVIVMYQGKIVEEGDVEAIFRNPQEAYTKELLASIPVEHPKNRR